MPPSSSDRAYQAKDALASLKNFYIELVDDEGNYIKFVDEWEIQLAIFFI